jgi:ATP-dependent Clp protease protease subunit
MNKNFYNSKKKHLPKKKNNETFEDEGIEFPFDLIGSTDNLNEKNISQNEYYLYSAISIDAVTGLLKFIKHAEKRWQDFLFSNSHIIENAQPKPLKIYINSEGGELFAAIPLIDAITNCKIPVYTYIEGIAASAASLISMAGHKRFITKNSFMLIHEIRSGIEGTYSNIADEKENCDKLMKVIYDFYKNKTNDSFTNESLTAILKRDIILNSQECLNFGLVDEIL